MRVKRCVLETNELAYYLSGADVAGYWDRLWTDVSKEHRLAASLARRQRFSFESLITARYLGTHDGPLLEGGCGAGRVLSQLTLRGYECIGIDSSTPTVEMLHRCAPHLCVRVADVQSLPFPSEHFAGYWSIGVIEHFEDGYGPVLGEARRVLRPGGVLFLSFPFMNAWRLRRATRGGYLALSPGEPPGTFFQYALEPSRVLADLEELGFRRVAAHPIGFFFGVADEISWTTGAIATLARLKSRSGPTSLACSVADLVLASIGGFALAHTLLLVLRRE